MQRTAVKNRTLRRVEIGRNARHTDKISVSILIARRGEQSSATAITADFGNLEPCGAQRRKNGATLFLGACRFQQIRPVETASKMQVGKMEPFGALAILADRKNVMISTREFISSRTERGGALRPSPTPTDSENPARDLARRSALGVDNPRLQGQSIGHIDELRRANAMFPEIET